VVHRVQVQYVWISLKSGYKRSLKVSKKLVIDGFVAWVVPKHQSRFEALSVNILLQKISFHSEKLLAPCPTPKLEDHPLSAVHNCLFNIFAATHHIGGRSSICNLRMRHAMVPWTHLSHGLQYYNIN
jgi:hypothetical protein